MREGFKMVQKGNPSFSNKNPNFHLISRFKHEDLLTFKKTCVDTAKPTDDAFRFNSFDERVTGSIVRDY